MELEQELFVDELKKALEYIEENLYTPEQLRLVKDDMYHLRTHILISTGIEARMLVSYNGINIEAIVKRNIKSYFRVSCLDGKTYKRVYLRTLKVEEIA